MPTPMSRTRRNCGTSLTVRPTSWRTWTYTPLSWIGDCSTRSEPNASWMAFAGPFGGCVGIHAATKQNKAAVQVENLILLGTSRHPLHQHIHPMQTRHDVWIPWLHRLRSACVLSSLRRCWHGSGMPGQCRLWCILWFATRAVAVIHWHSVGGDSQYELE